jgi:hypothetical protein
MKIPPYWSKAQHPVDNSKGRTDSVSACGWSFSSLEDAKVQAALRAKRIFDIVSKGQKPDTYDYCDRPVKEEIIREILDEKEQIALITRNRYGSLVLNSAKVLFADIDFPPASPKGFLEILAFMFMPKKREEKRQAIIVETTQRITQWASSNPSRSFRMYRTQQGLRLLFTDKLYDPISNETMELLHALNSDPMYIKLTQKQECFRARLTAKPWRCGCSRPPSTYPRDNAEADRLFQQWETQYTNRASKFRACEFQKAFGTVADIRALKVIINAHDQGSMIDYTVPLA